MHLTFKLIVINYTF